MPARPLATAVLSSILLPGPAPLTMIPAILLPQVVFRRKVLPVDFALATWMPQLARLLRTAQERVEKLFLAPTIQVNSPSTHPGRVCDVAHSGLVISLADDDSGGRIQNLLLAFVVVRHVLPLVLAS